MARRLTPVQLRTRIDALDAMRLHRPLTTAERAEADNLAHRLYMREYRAGPAYALAQSRRARPAEARHG
jgi:hypothetical protein